MQRSEALPTDAPRAPSSRKRRPPPPPRPLLAALILATIRSVGRLSLRNIHRLAATVAALLARLPLRPRRNTIESLELAMPELTPEARKRLAHRSLVEDLKMLLEHAAFWTWPPPRVLALLKVVEGEEVLARALADGKGVILAVPHLGAMEAISVYAAARHGLIAQYRVARLRELDSFMQEARCRFGAQLIAVGTASVRQMLRGLHEGRLVGIPCDQDPGRDTGVFAPYFGRMTNTTTQIGRLASRTGAAVVIGWCERLPKSAGFALHFEPAPPEVTSEDPIVSATALNAAIERCVRRIPEQALWSYRRFRVQPRLPQTDDKAGATAGAATELG